MTMFLNVLAYLKDLGGRRRRRRGKGKEEKEQVFGDLVKAFPASQHAWHWVASPPGGQLGVWVLCLVLVHGPGCCRFGEVDGVQKGVLFSKSRRSPAF